ncbi:uncharacterized protein LOC133884473 isoform X2 [Phragmites australis]|nr:uncharacterized protein LOC133884473 isoform X2 [Phragmites australis]
MNCCGHQWLTQAGSCCDGYEEPVLRYFLCGQVKLPPLYATVSTSFLALASRLGASRSTHAAALIEIGVKQIVLPPRISPDSRPGAGRHRLLGAHLQDWVHVLAAEDRHLGNFLQGSG